jgi:hypothetical protein
MKWSSTGASIPESPWLMGPEPPVWTSVRRSPARNSSAIFLALAPPLPVISSSSIPKRFSKTSFKRLRNSAPGGIETTTFPSFFAAATI